MKRHIKIVVYCLEWGEVGRCCVGGSSRAAGTEQGGRWRGYCSDWTSHQFQGGRVNLVTPVLPHFCARWQSELQPVSQTLWMQWRELRNSGRNTGTSSRHSGSSPCKCFYFPFCITCCFCWAEHSESPPKANQVVKQSKQSQAGWRLKQVAVPNIRSSAQSFWISCVGVEQRN